MHHIQKTKDYSLFKMLEGNRRLDKYHLKKLKKAIEEENQLNIHPIIVNKHFCVIDGQHRLQVAKELDLEVFYIQSENVSDLHVIGCNVNQKQFEVENYIDYFAVKERKEDYIQLKEMLKSTTLRPKALLNLIIGIVSPAILEFLKTGKFKFPSNQDPLEVLNFYFDFVNYVKDKRIKPFSMFTNYYFTRAIRWIFKTKGFEAEVFFKKLDQRWFDLKPQRSAEDWYTLLINIYNFKNQNKLPEEYAVDR